MIVVLPYERDRYVIRKQWPDGTFTYSACFLKSETEAKVQFVKATLNKDKPDWDFSKNGSYMKWIEQFNRA